MTREEYFKNCFEMSQIFTLGFLEYLILGYRIRKHQKISLFFGGIEFTLSGEFNGYAPAILLYILIVF